MVEVEVDEVVVVLRVEVVVVVVEQPLLKWRQHQSFFHCDQPISKFPKPALQS